MKCQGLKVVIATTSPDLYKNNWLFNKQMYWGVDCLSPNQLTVSDNIKPNVSLQPLVKSPSEICIDCLSTTLHIVFTQNPESTNPGDYIQFVIKDVKVTDMSEHNITDKNIIIEEVNYNKDYNLMEIWLGIGTSKSDFSGKELTTKITDTTQKSGLEWWVWLIIVGLVVLMVVGGVMVYGFTRRQKEVISTVSYID